MMKILGLIFIMLFAIAVGVRESHRQLTLAKNTNKAYQMLSRIKMLLRYSQPDKCVLMQVLSQEGYSELISDEEPKIKLDNEVAAIVNQYLCELGTRDLVSELEALEYSISLVGQRLELVNESSFQKSRLYTSLGILSGTFAIIMLI